ALSRRNYNVEATSSTDEALAWSQARGYDAALLDLVMPERDGMSLATALRVHQPALPIAILTGYTNSPLLEDAARARIAVIKKPVATQDLVDFLETHTGT
ncbi:MAG: response regulator, partial [Vicinamibacteria bacterium]|nr:response regulator [Vicinamibacteria bacterium]